MPGRMSIADETQPAILLPQKITPSGTIGRSTRLHSDDRPGGNFLHGMSSSDLSQDEMLAKLLTLNLEWESHGEET